MKKALLILILFIGIFNSYSQINNISITTLQTLTNMTSNQFEDWALSKGYKFSEIVDYNYFKVVYYKNGNKNQISFKINKEGVSKGYVFYETTNNIEYSNLKTSCTKTGYKYDVSTNSVIGDEERVYHTYRKENYKLGFNILNEKEFQYGYNVSIENSNYQ